MNAEGLGSCLVFEVPALQIQEMPMVLASKIPGPKVKPLYRISQNSSINNRIFWFLFDLALAKI